VGTGTHLTCDVLCSDSEMLAIDSFELNKLMRRRKLEDNNPAAGRVTFLRRLKL
jgi:hypothetical protein